MSSVPASPDTRSTARAEAPALTRPVQHALLVAGVLGLNLANSNAALAQVTPGGPSCPDGVTFSLVPGSCGPLFEDYLTAFSAACNPGNSFSYAGASYSFVNPGYSYCAASTYSETIHLEIGSNGETVHLVPVVTAPASAVPVPANTPLALVGLAAALGFAARATTRRRKGKAQHRDAA